MNIAAVGNLSLPAVTEDPKNDWDGYRMAAVYSENFHAGPGLRLYYHAENLTGAAYVQELIWTQSTDSWANGAKLHNPWPNSHLAATIDESTQILRLFFSSGNNTLQESWMSLSDSTGTYKNGMHLGPKTIFYPLIERKQTLTCGTLRRRQLPQPPRPQQRRHRRHVPKRLNLPLPLQRQRSTRHPRNHHHRHPRLLRQQPRSLQHHLPSRRHPEPRHHHHHQ